jgi:hypothetical protein
MEKGSIGLFVTMMLSESSPSNLHLKLTKTTTADALLKELSISQPALMGRLIHTVPE